MKVVGRNELCPCGSMKKFKHCHGSLTHTGAGTGASIATTFAHEIRKIQRKSNSHRSTYGDVKEIITAEANGFRFVASGKKLVFSKTWKVFPDFLNQHLHSLLGKAWGERQVQLPYEKQHPIIQWRTSNALATMNASPDKDGLYGADTGAANAWFRLAYDLYLVEHNAELQKKLLKRLRDERLFQGARFEAAVAALMLASGYELEYCDERGPGKHPEFIATPKEDGPKLAVEAKSRHRPGVLGFQSKEKPCSPAAIEIDGLLRDALNKDPKEPLLVFIELNLPIAVDPDSAREVYEELNSAWIAAQNRYWPNGFPAIGVVFYNDTSPWYLSTSLPHGDGKVPIWAMIFWPDASRHNFNAKPLLTRIAQGCIQRLTIPQD
jgi:SEC-C motif